MNKLRLLLFEDCNQNCPGCCNKDWDLDGLPVCDDYSPYDIIMLTGGEPLLRPNLVHGVIRDIRKTSKAEIYVYTANLAYPETLMSIAFASDGITVTLHNQSDVAGWLYFASITQNIKRSWRVNIFKGIKIYETPHGWIVKQNIEWIPNCPLPKDETFMRLK